MYDKKRISGNTRYSNQILGIDESYVKSVVLNCVGDNYRILLEKVCNTPYNKYESTCPLCFAGNKKRQQRPAVFIPTEVGYLFKCLSCMSNDGAISLYNFLSRQNPELARKYQSERWLKKLTGKGFNIKNPDRELKREYYQSLEQQLKEKNKLEYELKHGNILQNQDPDESR